MARSGAERSEATSGTGGGARRPAVCVIAFAALLLAPSAARGQGQVSLTAGLSVPAGAVFRDVYGSPLTSFGVQGNWQIDGSGWGVFGGVRLASPSGEAVVEGTGQPSGEQVKLRTVSMRAGPSWTFGRPDWQVTMGAGPSYGFYRETWGAAGPRQEASGIGFVFQATLGRALTRRLGVLLRVERSVFNVEAPGEGLGQVTLGATDISGGIAFRF